MPTRVTQAAFTSGELTPALHGRIDMDQYVRGLVLCKNFIVHPHGGISNRTGMRFVCEVKDSSVPVNLIEFNFNDLDTYCLEFGNLYMRVIRNGGQVLYPVGHASAGQIVEIVTPYTTAEVFDMQYVQSADIITIVHPNHPPAVLARTDHHEWTLTDIAFQPALAAPTGAAVGTQTVGAGSTSRRYKVTAYNTETAEESLPSNIAATTTDSDQNWIDGEYISLSWSAVADASKYNIYKDENGLFGYIGSTDVLGFNDTKYAPDLEDTPPSARDPFDAPGNYPSTVTYYEQRLAYAASVTGPQKIWFSQVGNFNNMNISEPLKDSDAITLRIDANQVNEVRHLVPINELITLTSGAEHMITSGDLGFSIGNIKVKPQGRRGASRVRPLVVGSNVLYVQSKGKTVRNMGYDLKSNSYQGGDMSILASHLFEDSTITQWAFAEAPNSLIWVVMLDGSLRGLTYVKEHEVTAWHQHETDGDYESVAVIGGADRDIPYFVVKRTINGQVKRYIEYLEDTTKIVEDSFYVDSGLSYAGAPVTALSGLGHLEGKTVSILADGNVHPQQVVSAGAITLDYPASKVSVGLPIQADMQTLEPPLQGTLAKYKAISRLTIRVRNSRGLLAGPNADNLFPLKQRTNEAWGDPVALVTGEFEVVLSPSWNDNATLHIRQVDPLPLTILAVTPDVEVGG